ncbi:MAG: ABC transporter ATP-binding protein [Bacteroidales bacterium]
MVIRVKDIRKSFGKLEVLKGVDLQVQSGEIVSVVGASGAGKSTLLHIMGTLDRPSSGEIWFDDRQVLTLNDDKLSEFRNRHIGFVFQFHHLLPEFTALENICIPAFIAGMGKREAEKRAAELLELTGLSDRAGHKPAELSGGEQQRVAVARALMNQPDILLADEPSGNLDSASAQSLHQLFFDLRSELGQTFVIVTHNPLLADMADRKVEIVDGRIVHHGK